MGAGQAIPYLDNTFDVLLCLETLEHVVDAAALRTEIIRVLRPGGICMLATPARLKYLFRPDPHFGIPGLLLLPATTKSRQAHCGSASAMSCGTDSHYERSGIEMNARGRSIRPHFLFFVQGIWKSRTVLPTR